MSKYSVGAFRQIMRRRFKPVAATTLYTQAGPAEGTVWLSRGASKTRQTVTVRAVGICELPESVVRFYEPEAHDVTLADFHSLVAAGQFILVGIDAAGHLPTEITIP